MRTLRHNQRIRVKGFDRAQKITIGTARGYAAESDMDPEEVHARCVERGHHTVWTNQAPSILTADYPGKHEELERERRLNTEAPEIEDGELVEIDGRTWETRVIGQRYANPVHFVPDAIPDADVS